MGEKSFRLFWWAAAALASGAAPGADVVTIEPGLWQSTMSMESSFMPAMPPQTVTECIRETAYDIDQLLGAQGDCTISSQVVTGSTVHWKMTCDTDGGPVANGEGEPTSQGDRVSGQMTLKMNYQGQSMDTKTSWTAKRLGDC